MDTCRQWAPLWAISEEGRCIFGVAVAGSAKCGINAIVFVTLFPTAQSKRSASMVCKEEDLTAVFTAAEAFNHDLHPKFVSRVLLHLSTLPTGTKAST